MKKFMIISCLLIFVCGCDGDIEGQGSSKFVSDSPLTGL